MPVPVLDYTLGRMPSPEAKGSTFFRFQGAKATMTDNLGLPKQKKLKRGRESKREGIDTAHNDDADEEEQLRRIKRHLRRQEKRIEELRKQGLDENGEPLDNFSLDMYPVRESKVKVPCSQELMALNPVVTILSIAVLWGLVIWSIVNPVGSTETLFLWQSFVSTKFGWFMQGSKAVIFFFLIYVTYKYGHIHLGQKGDKPRYSNFSYFAMIMAAGGGPYLLATSASEALWHQADNFFANAGYRSQDEIDMFAINMAVSNMGIVNWTHFALVAICASLVTHRFQLPMTFRACFYPILGSYTWGWIGDFIDAAIVIVSVIGSSDNLRVSAEAISAALKYKGWTSENATEDEVALTQNMIIWVITILSTISVLYGLQNTIQITSCLALSLGSLLTFVVFIMDDTKFLLNLVVQECGYFLQTSVFELNLWTDAFGRIEEGSGRAVDGRAADQDWMDSWTLVYVAYVICVAASFGTFIASISHGRKLWEVVLYTLAAPIFYCLVWYCIWSGIGFRQLRQAQEMALLGETYFNNSAHFLASGSEVCFDVPQNDVVVGEDVIFTNYLPGITPVCLFDEDDANFNVLYSFQFPDSMGANGLGPFLSFLYVLGIVLYLVVNGDCVTLVVDSLVSNGRRNYHWMRRMFWACTVGAMTTALTSLGDGSYQGGLHSALLAASLPVAIMMCYLPQSILRLCRAAEQDEPFDLQNDFSMPIYGGVFNVLEYVASWGKVHSLRVELGMNHVTRFQFVEFVKGVLVPYVSLNQVVRDTYPGNRRTNMTLVGCYALCYCSWLVLLSASWAQPGVGGCVWAVYIVTGVTLAMVRSGFRATHQLSGNIIDDVAASLLCWPQVFVQMRLQSIGSINLGTNASKKKEQSEAER